MIKISLFQFVIIAITCILILCSFCCKASEESDELSISSKEIEAKQYIKNIMPSITRNLDWLSELYVKDRTKISFIDELSLEFEIEDVYDFLQNLSANLTQYQYENFTDEELKLEIKNLIIHDYKILPDDERNEMMDIIKQSSAIHEHVKFCDFENHTNCNLRYSDVFTSIYTKDEEELRWWWLQWRDNAGRKRRSKFDRLTELYRRAANLNGYKKPTEMMLEQFNDTNIIEKFSFALEQLRPLYQQLHAYIRHKLQEDYDSDRVAENLSIPLHYHHYFEFSFPLHITEEFYPFSNSSVIKLYYKEFPENYTIDRMVEEARKYLGSMEVRDSLIDFELEYNNKLISICDEKSLYYMCETKSVGLYNSNGFYIIIHNSTNIENFLKTLGAILNLYRHFASESLSFPFRDMHFSFFDCIKEAIELSAITRSNLIKLELISPEELTQEAWINHLFFMALTTLYPRLDSFTESTYLADILDGKLNSTDSNCIFWDLQQKYLGTRPPVKRSKFDFDAIAGKLEGYENNDFEDIFSTLLSFKIYEGLCKKAGKFSDNDGNSELSDCDLSGSKEVGETLLSVFSAGATKSWQELLEELTGDSEINGLSILKYFRPLENWLKEYNNKHDVHVGWENLNICD